jgi:ABC-type branched-subunit amino acid transport system substrate-binding protein
MRRRSVLLAAAGSCFIEAAHAEAGVTDKEVIFGQTAILSGALGVPVKARMVGAELAFAASQQQGGVYGRSVRVVSLDDELKPDRAVANYQRLLDNEHVFAFFGCGGSATTAAAADVLKRSGAPLVGGFAVGDSARDKVKGYAYFLRSTSRREAEALIEHLDTIGSKRIAIGYLDNPGGIELRALIEEAMAKRKLTPVATSAVKGDGANVAEAAKVFNASNPQIVLMYLGGALPGQLINAMTALGARPMFYGMSIVAGELTAKVAGERAHGLVIAEVVPYPWGQVEPTAVEFRRLAEAAKVPVDYYTYEGYLTGLMLLEALKRCGRDLTRARLQATMRSLKMRLGGMDLDFTGGGHTGASFVDLVQVTREGHFVR